MSSNGFLEVLQGLFKDLWRTCKGLLKDFQRLFFVEEGEEDEMRRWWRFGTPDRSLRPQEVNPLAGPRSAGGKSPRRSRVPRKVKELVLVHLDEPYTCRSQSSTSVEVVFWLETELKSPSQVPGSAGGPSPCWPQGPREVKKWIHARRAQATICQCRRRGQTRWAWTGGIARVTGWTSRAWTGGSARVWEWKWWLCRMNWGWLGFLARRGKHWVIEPPSRPTAADPVFWTPIDIQYYLQDF